MSGNSFAILLAFIMVARPVRSDEEPSAQFSFSAHFMESVMENMIRMEHKIEQLDKELTIERELRQQLSCNQSKEAISAKTSRSVAFRAHLSSNLGAVTTGIVIKFDQVDLNLGNAYQGTSGIFTAPENGTYLFSMVIGNPAGNPGAFFMRKNGVGMAYAIAGHTTGWNIGGVTTVAALITGDKVWVTGEGHVAGAYPTARYHTSFSGVLVHAS